MTDSMPTTRMIVPTSRAPGALAVGNRRREKRERPAPPARAKTDRPVTNPDQDRADESDASRAIDIRI